MSWKYQHSKEYLDLIKKFPLTPISSREQNTAAIAIIKDLSLNACLTPAQSDYFDVLCQLITTYEKRFVSHETISPQDALLFLMEQNDLTQTDISVVSGIQRSHISEFLSGKRGLSKDAAAKLGARFKVDPMSFLPKVQPLNSKLSKYAS